MQTVRDALEFSEAKAHYRQGCDSKGYRADEQRIEELLGHVETIAADTSQPVELRLQACNAVSGLAGMVARNEKSISYGRKSYGAALGRCGTCGVCNLLRG